MVSVIIVNFNTYQLTQACIRSVYAWSRGEVPEVIVVDNASSEQNVEELLGDFPDLIVIKNKENLGFAKANNIGIEAAKGDSILLLNSDAEFKNDAINICREVLEKNPAIGIVTAQLRYPDGKIQHNCQSFPSLVNEAIEISRLHKVFGKSYASVVFRGSFFNHLEDCYCDWVWGTFFMFRKADLQKLKEKKLSDLAFMYGEDMEWCYQFYLAGMKTFFAANAKVLHHLGGSEFGNKEEKSKQIIMNEMAIAKKYKGSDYAKILMYLRWIKYKILAERNPEFRAIASLYQQLLKQKNAN